MLTYEQQLTNDGEWAVSEGSRHFEGRSAIAQALKRIAQRLDELEIPYAVAGGMALFHHGFRRFTEDVDILINPDDLRTVHDQLVGRGYVPPFRGSKNLRDAELGVRIEFLVAGQFPGDGKPKEISFPDPATIAPAEGDVKYVDLPTLVELKLASGISGADRLKDLADVQELIKVLDLPTKFSESLHPSVQAEFGRIWSLAQSPGRRYLRRWPKASEDHDELDSMLNAGVVREPGEDDADFDYLVTTDEELARRVGMHPEDEFLE